MFPIRNKYIFSIIIFWILVSCEQSSNLNLDNKQNIRELELDTNYSGWPKGNVGVKLGVASNGMIKYQVLLNPLRDTVHMTEYERGVVLKDTGLYFYTTKEFIGYSLDSSASYRFYHNILLPRPDITSNLCLFEYNNDSLKYCQIGQYFVGKNRFVMEVKFSNPQPIIYWSILFAYRDGTIYKYIVHEPYRLRPATSTTIPH